jgi:hypothetical protein
MSVDIGHHALWHCCPLSQSGVKIRRAQLKLDYSNLTQPECIYNSVMMT